MTNFLSKSPLLEVFFPSGINRSMSQLACFTHLNRNGGDWNYNKKAGEGYVTFLRSLTVAVGQLESTSYTSNPDILSLVKQKTKIVRGLLLPRRTLLHKQDVGEVNFPVGVLTVFFMWRDRPIPAMFASSKFTLNRKVTEDYLKCLQSRNDKSEKPSITFPGNWIQSADLKRLCFNNAIIFQRS